MELATSLGTTELAKPDGSGRYLLDLVAVAHQALYDVDVIRTVPECLIAIAENADGWTATFVGAEVLTASPEREFGSLQPVAFARRAAASASHSSRYSWVMKPG